MNIIKSINVLGIDFDIYKGPIGISFSGGADSSLLLYMLMLNSSEKIHIFTTVNNLKNRKNSIITSKVIDKCIELTGNINIEHHLNYVEEQDISNLFSICKKWLINNYIKVIYTGITNTPPIEILESFKNKIDSVDGEQRKPNIIKPTFSNKFYMPFNNINKQKIADLYNHYKLINNLFPLTRSCEWTTCYGEPDPGIGHCNKCWWCEERIWGFNKFNKRKH